MWENPVFRTPRGQSELTRPVIASGAVTNWPLLLAPFVWVCTRVITSLLSDEAPLASDSWLAWQLTPAVLVPLLLAGALYVAGARRGATGKTSVARRVSFAGGLIAIFIALQSPIEALADHSLAVHEVEHMLLRTVGPMLLVLADPQAHLLRGLPDWLRRGIFAPVLSARPVRMLFAVLGHPAIATALFVGVNAFWMLPSSHNLALANESVHWWMHVSLVVTGLLFFARLLDPRRPPYGPALSVRLLMGWAAIMGAIVIGFTVTFSPRMLYPAYEASGLAWGVSPRLNQIYGGQTGWIPASMMLVVALMAMVYRWGRQEERDAERRGRTADGAVLSAAEFIAGQRARNRTLALGLTGFAVAVLGLALGGTLVYEGLRHQAQQPSWHDVAG